MGKNDKADKASKAAERKKAEDAWKAAQADIARHDAEFERKNPNWEQEHGS